MSLSEPLAPLLAEQIANYRAIALEYAVDIAPAGRVFFVDDNARTPEELSEGGPSTTIRRRLADGSSFRLVNVPYQPHEMEERLQRLGRHITVPPATGPYYWGAGTAGTAAAKPR